MLVVHLRMRIAIDECAKSHSAGLHRSWRSRIAASSTVPFSRSILDRTVHTTFTTTRFRPLDQHFGRPEKTRRKSKMAEGHYFDLMQRSFADVPSTEAGVATLPFLEASADLVKLFGGLNFSPSRTPRTRY